MWRTPLAMGPSPFTKLTTASLSEKIIPFAVKSGNNSCKMCQRMRITDFNIVVSPSNLASNEERQVLPDVVALVCTAPELRPRATMNPSILRWRGPVARDASVLLRIETAEVPPSTSGMCCVVYKYPRT